MTGGARPSVLQLTAVDWKQYKDCRVDHKRAMARAPGRARSDVAKVPGSWSGSISDKARWAITMSCYRHKMHEDTRMLFEPHVTSRMIGCIVSGCIDIPGGAGCGFAGRGFCARVTRPVGTILQESRYNLQASNKIDAIFVGLEENGVATSLKSRLPGITIPDILPRMDRGPWKSQTSKLEVGRPTRVHSGFVAESIFHPAEYTVSYHEVEWHSLDLLSSCESIDSSKRVVEPITRMRCESNCLIRAQRS